MLYALIVQLGSNCILVVLLQKGKRKVQVVPQSQTAALLRHQKEEEKTKPNKRKSNKRTKSTKINSLFPPDRHSGSVVERPLCDREVAGSIPGRVIPKTLKMVLAALSLGAQH